MRTGTLNTPISAVTSASHPVNIAARITTANSDAPNAAVWRIQTDGKHVHTETKSVAARARLVRPIPFSIVKQREVTCDIFARYISFATTGHAPIERVIAALRAWKRDDEAFDALPVSHNHSFNPVVLREHTYVAPSPQAGWGLKHLAGAELGHGHGASHPAPKLGGD